MTEAKTIVAGLGLLEGPVWRPAQRDLLITVVGAGRLLRVDVDAGTAAPFAETGGGPNGAYPCGDGGVLVSQNGGLDWAAIGIANPTPSAPATPGLQRVHPDGRVEPLTDGDGPFRAPNDLCVGPDGAVWFTDPPQFPPPAEPVGRVWRWSPGRPAEVVADGFTYCNGIGVASDGTVIVVEGPGLMRVADRSWFVERLPSQGDGFAFDVDGNLYVAGGSAIAVVSPSGEVVDQMEAPSTPATFTNCCFGGDDLRTLYVTEIGGRVTAFTGMPVAGVPMTPLDL